MSKTETDFRVTWTGERWQLSAGITSDFGITAATRPELLAAALHELERRTERGVRKANVVWTLLDGGNVCKNDTQRRGAVQCEDLTPEAIEVANALFNATEVLHGIRALLAAGEFEDRPPPRAPDAQLAPELLS